MQLGKQVMTALNAALQGESGSAILRELAVVAVEPHPDATRMRVEVAGEIVERLGASQVLEHLRGARGFLRTQVATAISRKRVPELVFAISTKEPGHEA